MSSYAAQQSSYGATGFEFTNTRTVGPTRNGMFMPLSVQAPIVSALGHTMLLTGPVFF